MDLSRVILPDKCWFTFWRSCFQSGLWAQHGYDRGARRFFSDDKVANGNVGHWIVTCHQHRPCEPFHVNNLP